MMEEKKMEKVKLVYKDGEKTKVLKGDLIKETDTFIEIDCDYNLYLINKKDVISLKTRKERGRDKDREGWRKQK